MSPTTSFAITCKWSTAHCSYLTLPKLLSTTETDPALSSFLPEPNLLSLHLPLGNVCWQIDLSLVTYTALEIWALYN